MLNEPPHPPHDESRELSVKELLRRARPLPPRTATVVDDLTDVEAKAFFDAISRRAD